MKAMSGVRFGLALRNFAPHTEPLDLEGIVAYANQAEELGFDSLWAWDHILLGSKRPFAFLESLSVLAALSATTTRVSLGTGILVLPLRHPVVLAKVTSSIDQMSHGRLVLGVAAGWYEREFEACGVPYKSRGEVFLRNLDVLTRFWTEERVEGSADGMVFRNAVMMPRPVQQPHPTLLIGGYVDRVLRRVATKGDGWLTYFYLPESFRKAWGKIRDFAEMSGRDPADLVNVAQLPICVGSSFEQADARVRRFIGEYFDIAPWSESTIESAIRGTPEHCAEQIAAHVEAGVQDLVLVPCEYEAEQMTAIARDVIPLCARVGQTGVG